MQCVVVLGMLFVAASVLVVSLQELQIERHYSNYKLKDTTQTRKSCYLGIIVGSESSLPTNTEAARNSMPSTTTRCVCHVSVPTWKT